MHAAIGRWLRGVQVLVLLEELGVVVQPAPVLGPRVSTSLHVEQEIGTAAQTLLQHLGLSRRFHLDHAIPAFPERSHPLRSF